LTPDGGEGAVEKIQIKTLNHIIQKQRSNLYSRHHSGNGHVCSILNCREIAHCHLQFNHKYVWH